MPRLTATFQVSLSHPLFVSRPPWREGVRIIPELRYATTINDSAVEIVLLEIYHAMTSMDRGGNILRGPLWAVPRMHVSVSRSETIEPPPTGRPDRGTYFRERAHVYRRVALEALCRCLRFFKYRQAHALLRDPIGADLNNPERTDEGGQAVRSGLYFHEGSLYGIELDDDVGIHALAGTDDSALQQALAEPPIEPELYE
jgi:hypothetical protein